MTKKVLLIGGNGGIGVAVSAAFSDEYEVHIVTRKEIDFSERSAYTLLSKKIAELQPDIVLNCAGYFTDNSETHYTTMDVNFGANWAIVKHYIDNITEHDVKIVLVGSSAHREGRKKYMLYAASKAALYNLWLSAAEYFADSRISVSLVNPVKTKTKMLDKNATRYIMPEDVAQAILACAKDKNNTCIDLDYKE